MSVKILIPGALRQQVGGSEELEVQAKNVKDALLKLVECFPELRDYLFSGDNRLRNFISVYVNEEDIRSLRGEETRLSDGDVVAIIPAVAGGSSGTASFGDREILRYDRHLIMPEVGFEGQKRLKEASILIVGLGGLGTPAATYLTAAGVGRLGLVDFDFVEYSNLHRQVLYSEDDIGRLKVEVAAQRLKEVNPNVKVEPYRMKLDSRNATELLSKYDIILDGTDNFPTRYLVNDACVLLGKPNIYSSIFRFEGQSSVFYAREGPCYRCVYPEPPPPELVPSCAEGGVFGVLPSVMGSIQAVEAIKMILRQGRPLIGRLLLFDALKMQFREMKLRKDPSCPVCGKEPKVTRLIDYEEFCGIKKAQDEGLEQVSAHTLADWIREGRNFQLLDVREKYEFEFCRLPGARLIPLSELRSRLSELERDRTVVAYCHHGERSMAAVRLLKARGFRDVRNLEGGINAWSEQVDSNTPKY
jgi:molybdopterin/thiamine biosynthesis adenylyltransferase/rhodanese-related sulfurtransferase/molybdopterin converting factor small subunit